MKSLFLTLSALVVSGMVLAQTTQPTTPVTPPTTPTAPVVQPVTPKPVVSPIGWPPKLALGQRWILTLEPVGQWDIALTARDKDGDPIGTAKATTEKTLDFQVFFYYAAKDDVTNLYLSASNGSGFLCQFSQNSLSNNPNDVTMIGASYKKELNKPFEKLDSLCIVTWTNSPVSPLSIQPTNTPTAPTVTTPPPVVVTPPVVNSPTNGTATDVKPPASALALVWSPKIEVGQTWLARIGNLSFDISLQRLAAGVARGTAKRGTVTGDAFMFYNSSENRMTLELSLGTDSFICSFDLKGAFDKAYTGGVVYRSGSNVAQTLKEQCALFRTK
jgi:hypothetical protein